MQAGKLNQRITFPAVVRAQDNFGGTVETASPAQNVSVWASVHQMTPTEIARNGTIGSDNAYACRIRYRDGVTGQSKVVYRNRTLELAGDPVAGGKNNREWLDFVAKETR